MGNNVAIIKHTSYIEDGEAFGRERKELFRSTEVLMERLTLSRLNIDSARVGTNNRHFCTFV